MSGNSHMLESVFFIVGGVGDVKQICHSRNMFIYLYLQIIANTR